MTYPKVRERDALNRCDSDTDCTVRMEEDFLGTFYLFMLWRYPEHFLLEVSL